MNKLRELLARGWTVSATYDYGIFYLIATYSNLDIVKSAKHPNLEMAVTELYEKCVVTDVSITS